MSYGSNRGVNCARNYGVKNGFCDWIVFMDSYGYFADDALDIIIDSMSKYQNLKMYVFANENKNGIRKC